MAADGAHEEDRPCRRRGLPGHVRRFDPAAEAVAEVIADPIGYISHPSSNAALQWGSVLGFLTAVSGVATAVRLYPVTRRVSRSAAIGFVASRVVEGALILVGVVAILSVITLQQHFAGAPLAQAQALGVAGESLVAMRQWTFLLSPGVMAGVNDLLLGYISYRSGWWAGSSRSSVWSAVR